MNGLEDFGKCPKCGQLHDQFKGQGHLLAHVDQDGEIAVSCTCINCGVTFQRQYIIDTAHVELVIYYDDSEHIMIDNRPQKKHG